jgi:hypothetical protein
MVQLQPQKNFTVVRQIADHTDTATYYIRAVIRNAYTDEIITTLNLEDKGGQRFKKDWQVPADPSEEGFYISIITSVYEDSGYTTKSGNYGDEENTYLVFDRIRANRGGGGGGPDISSIRRVVKEEIESAKPKEELKGEEKKPEPMRWDEILKAVSALSEKVSDIKPAEKVNLDPVIFGLHKIIEAIRDKEVTPKTDLDPILLKLDEQQKENTLNTEALKRALPILEETLTKAVRDDLRVALKNVQWSSSFVTKANGVDYPEAEMREEKPAPIDINKLSL